MAISAGDLVSELTMAGPGDPPQRRDWIIVAVLAALVVAEVVVDPSRWAVVSLAPAAVALGALPWRRVAAVPAAIAAFVAQFAVELIAWLADADDVTTGGHVIAGLMLAYALCRWPAPRLVAVGLTVIVALVFSGELLDGGSLGENLLFLVPWLVLGLLALAMRYRADLIEQRNTRIRLAERNALARELHDSVAHHVSAIAVQAQAAQFVGDRDPTAALEAVGSIERIANEAIDEMRRMVGVLRSDDDRALAVAATDLGVLADPGGRPRVSMIGETDLEPLPAPVAAAVYRIAQEAITNARRHSRDVTFVDVDLSVDSSAAVLEVVNDGSPIGRRGGGYGLVGMRERVESLGGTLEAGPRPASGWQVLATIPLA